MMVNETSYLSFLYFDWSISIFEVYHQRWRDLSYRVIMHL